MYTKLSLEKACPMCKEVNRRVSWNEKTAKTFHLDLETMDKIRDKNWEKSYSNLTFVCPSCENYICSDDLHSFNQPITI